jgi:MFS family permease
VVTGEDLMYDAPRRPQGAALVVVCVASFMVALDITIVNIALPSIQHDLGFAATDIQWVLTGYALPFGGFLLVGGRLGDLLGRRRVFAGGLAVFALASLAGGLAAFPWMLVAARALQGLGAAALSPAAFALVTTVFPSGAQRDRALSAYAATGALGFTCGMIASGLLTQLAGWRWVFLVTVPVAVATLLAALVVVPDPPRPPRPPRPNLVGAITITLGLAALLYALEQASQAGWGAPATQASLGGGAGFLAGFAAIERRSAAPLIPAGFFRDPTVTVVNTVMLLKSTIGIAVLFVPTLYFQQVLDYSPSAIERVRVLGAERPEPAPETLVETRGFVRPQWLDGRLTLVTTPVGGGLVAPFEVPKPTPCCADHV